MCSYNQSGSYHLGGFEGTDPAKIPEQATWRLRSSTFTLGGSGWITVKMGGRAASVEIYTADNNTLIGRYTQSRFKDSDFPDVSKGSWLDMATYAINLSAYSGRQLYLVLCDDMTGNWGHAIFDEIVTYYTEAPDWENSYDTVVNSTGKEPATVQIKWQLAGTETSSQALNVTKTVSDKTATVTITEDAITQAVADAEGKPAVLTLDVKGDSNNTDTLKLSAATTNQIAGNDGVNALAVTLGTGEVIFDKTALAAAAGSGSGDVELSLKTVDKSALTDAQKNRLSSKTENLILDVSIKSDGTAVTDLGTGSLTVSVPFTPPSGMSAANYKLYHLTTDGVLQEVTDAVFSDGHVTFSTNHLSVWVALYEAGPQIVNGGFETGDLTGWTPIEYSKNGGVWPNSSGRLLGVISDASYWETRSYNQSGSRHLGGMNPPCGIDEDATWQLRSSDFVLSGSKWISVKMGGRAAAVKIYKKGSPDTLIGYYTQSHFEQYRSGERGYIMANYAIDLTGIASEGDTLYIVLCDVATDDWGQATFDEVVTYYPTSLADMVGEKDANGVEWIVAENLLRDNKLYNGDFETGMTGWTVVSGSAFGGNSRESTNTTYWSEGRYVYGWNSYYLTSL